MGQGVGTSGGLDGDEYQRMGSQGWSPRVGPQGVGSRWVRLRGVGPLVRDKGVGPMLVGPCRVSPRGGPSGVGWGGYEGFGPKGVGVGGGGRGCGWGGFRRPFIL